MTEKRYTVEMAIYKRREGSSNIGVNYICDNYSKNDKMVKCCGRNYVDVEVPESAIVFGDTNRHIINKVCGRLNEQNNLIIALREELELVDKENTELEKENKDLKEFIRKISTNNEIILANGTIYKIDKVIE